MSKDIRQGAHTNINFVCSVFSLAGRAGFIAPSFDIRYEEKDTENINFINGGGTRLYISRLGSNLDPSLDAQTADSHFIADRVIAALLVGGAGLFQPIPMGRILLDAPVDTLRWHTQLDKEPFYSGGVRAIHDSFDHKEFGSWFAFICQNTPIRRALHDAIKAMNDPVEAFIYIYRGFEWLKDGLDLSWEDIATDLGVTTKELKAVGQIANDETGVRHASRSGVKQRASLETYGTWIVGLIDAIDSARARIDNTYTASDSKRIVEKIKIAIPSDPYP